MLKYSCALSGAERELAALREELAAYLLRQELEGPRKWGYGALRELSNLSSLFHLPAPRPVSAKACMEGLADAAGGRSLHARLDQAPFRPALLDTSALGVVFFNLASNACRFSPDRAADLRIAFQSGNCRITVTNRAASRPSECPSACPSDGLGLAAARAAAGRLSGSLRVLFCAGRVTAALSFPLRPAGCAPAAPAASLTDFLGDPFSPAYVGLADLGYIPGCTGQ